MRANARDGWIPEGRNGSAAEDGAEEGAPSPEREKDVSGIKTIPETGTRLAEDAAEEQERG